MENLINYITSLRSVYNYIPSEIKKAQKKPFKHGNNCSNLYVYYDVNLISNIANTTCELWFKSANDFIDKEENAAWKSKFSSVLIFLQGKNCSKYNKKFKNIVIEAFKTYDIGKYNERYYICCLSYEPDNNLCWNTFIGNTIKDITKIKIEGQYKIEDEISNNKIILSGDKLSCIIEKKCTHGGCICFNKSEIDYIMSNDLSIKSGYINYSSKILKNKFCACLDFIYKMYKETNNLKNAITYIYNLIDYCNLFYKNDFYAGEKEYRYVYDSSLSLNNQELIKGNDNKGEKIYKLKFDKDSINHITITNSNDKSLFEKNYKGKIFLSKIYLNEIPKDKLDSKEISKEIYENIFEK